ASPSALTASDWYDRGYALKRSGDFAAALDAFRRSIKLNPRVAAPWIGLAQLLDANNQLEDARQCLQEATTADPRNALARRLLASSHQALGYVEDARRDFETALRIDPSSAPTYHGLGRLLEDLGEPEEAAIAYRKAIRLDPVRKDSLANLLGLGRHVDISAEIDDVSRGLENHAPRERAVLGYGLGKALEQRKEYGSAFRAFETANRARREESGPFDRKRFDSRIEKMIRLFSTDFFSSRKNLGSPSTRPVFIVGMPRSGTTLTEQVIGSHPDCFGAGELNALTDLATGTPDRLARAEPPWPHCAPDLDGPQLRALGQDYVERSAQRAPANALRVVDKQPLNFWHLGLVAIALPEARIVDCRRDIRDCGLSIFSHDFNLQQNWSTDLGDIAHYWRGYRRLMTHWASVTDLEILETYYEDTVSDLESQSRRLLEFLGLNWNEDVLRFHENQRAVQTPSRWQVRQPVYQSSKARWRHFGAHLAPLLQASESVQS
ncbi:MAG: sulfotransferase, partial [Pseudomonadota bacterium]